MKKQYLYILATILIHTNYTHAPKDTALHTYTQKIEHLKAYNHKAGWPLIVFGAGLAYTEYIMSNQLIACSDKLCNHAPNTASSFRLNVNPELTPTLTQTFETLTNLAYFTIGITIAGAALALYGTYNYADTYHHNLTHKEQCKNINHEDKSNQ